MYELSLEDMLLVAKIIAFVNGDKSIVLTDIDKDMAFRLMKKMIDQRYDMNPQQKEQYKLLLDIYKHMS